MVAIWACVSTGSDPQLQVLPKLGSHWSVQQKHGAAQVREAPLRLTSMQACGRPWGTQGSARVHS